MAEYRLEYDETAVADLRALRRVDQVTVLDAIERHLSHQPARVNRRAIKKLEPPVLAGYRLRVHDYRVFYDVYEERRVVLIVAIRFKGTMTLEEAARDPNR